MKKIFIQGLFILFSAFGGLCADEPLLPSFINRSFDGGWDSYRKGDLIEARNSWFRYLSFRQMLPEADKDPNFIDIKNRFRILEDQIGSKKEFKASPIKQMGNSGFSKKKRAGKSKNKVALNLKNRTQNSDKNQPDIGAPLEKAQRAYQSQRYDDALKLIEVAERIRPHDSRVLELKTKIQEKMQ